MNQVKQDLIAKRVAKTMENLRKNNMQAFFLACKEDVIAKIAELTKEGDAAACGGSVTLDECGVRDYLKSGRFQYIDRDETGISPEERQERQRRGLLADVFFCSANAVTENGELYNVDGNSNRVASILYGPKSVIMVVGINKIVPDLSAAVERVKKIAAPANCMRLGCQTYCSEKGECAAFTLGSKEITTGCRSDGRICSNYVISAKQQHKNRIKVLLVGEELGY